MTALILPKPFQKLLVTNSIHSKFEKINLIENIISNYERIIINGGIANLNDNLADIKTRIVKINQLINERGAIYILGRSDLEFLQQTNDDDVIKWFCQCPNIVIVNFLSHTVLITDGGIPLGIKHINQLLENIEVSFVSQINGKPWHYYYNGGLGYVISNNPISDKSPEYYNYSMRLGNKSDLYCQEFDEIGLKQTILI